MRLHSVLEQSMANGPGIRYVIWVQGCSRHCPGCFNPDAQAHSGGFERPVSRICSDIMRVPAEGLTVSGGEPFEQAQELALLLEAVQKSGLNTVVYTGFTYEELAARREKALLFCDYLIDGAFIASKLSDRGLAGSSNQRILQLKNGAVTADLTGSAGSLCTGEIIIDAEGNIANTGIFDGRLLQL